MSYEFICQIGRSQGPILAVSCPISHWYVEILSKSRGSNPPDEVELSLPIPYYIPILMVPMVTFMVICVVSTRCRFLCLTVLKSLMRPENSSDAVHPTWTNRKSSSFSFVPMERWDGDTPAEAVIEHSDNIANIIDVSNSFQRQHQEVEQSTENCGKLNSNKRSCKVNEPGHNTYDIVIQQLVQSFK